jgi:signal transduction histidine kinase
MEGDLDASGREIANSISKPVSSSILLDDRFAVTEQIMYTQGHNDYIRYILVIRPDGKVFASTFTSGLPQGLPAVRPTDAGTITYTSNEGYIREITCPIDDGLVGYFRIGLTEKTMMQVMTRRFVEMIAFIFCICIAAAALATRYASNFLGPVRDMARAVRQIGKGNFDTKLPVETSDDIGHLARAFNHMTVSLHRKNEENSHLVQELQAKEQMRLQLISQLFTAREDERRRISRELHDETSQSMVSILTYLRIIMDRTEDVTVKGFISDVRDLTKDTLEGLRHLAVNLHPPLLDDLGLVVAMEKYLDSFRRAQPDIHVTFTSDGDFSGLSRPASLLCYRMMQESLTNIVRHASATSAAITLYAVEGQLILSVADNGIGFTADTAEKARLDNHFGLVSMRERAGLLNGTFHITSKDGMGTTLTITLPMEAGSEGAMNHETTH